MKLNDIIDKIIDNRGKTPPTNKLSGVPLVEAQTYVDSYLYVNLDKCVKYVSDKVYNEWFRSGHPKKNDLLITLVGDLGNCSLVGDDKCCIAQNIIAIRFKDNVDPMYIYYMFQTSYYKKSIKALNRSSVQPSILVEDLLNLHIDLPCKKEQEKIVKILSKIDSIINNSYFLNKTIDKCEEELLNNLIKNNSNYKVKIKDLVTVDRGISYKGNEIDNGNGIPMVNLNSFLPNNSYKLIGDKLYSGKYQKSKTIKPFDLLMCVTQQTAIDLVYNTDVIGKVFLMPKIYANDVVCTMDVVRLLFDNENIKYYLYMFFKQKYFHKFISSYANGTKIKHLDCDGFLKLSINIPTEDKLIKYANIIKKLEEIKSNNLLETKKLLFERENLLLVLLNGQAKIKEVA